MPWDRRRPRGVVIGKGRYADVFEWNEGQIVKLFRADLPKHLAKREFVATRILHDAGLPVPEAYGVVTVDDRTGVVLERIEGPTMQDRLSVKGHPRIDVVTGTAQTLARLHASIHEHSEPRLPSQRERLEEGIAGAEALDADTRAELLDIVRDLPDSDVVCHDDLHPRNVIMSHRGPVVIDWLSASRGDPAADVARSLLVMRAGHEWDTTRVRELRRHFRSVYLHSWCFRTGVPPEEVLMWRVLMAALRLGEGFPGEERWLLHIIRDGMR